MTIYLYSNALKWNQGGRIPVFFSNFISLNSLSFLNILVHSTFIWTMILIRLKRASIKQWVFMKAPLKINMMICFRNKSFCCFFSSSHLNGLKSLGTMRGSYFEYIITQLSPFPAKKLVVKIFCFWKWMNK